MDKPDDNHERGIKMSGFEKFMQNPYWKEYYESAPTEKLKSYIRYIFEDSACEDENNDQYGEKAIEIRETFDENEWQWLIDHTVNNMARSFYKKKFEQLKNKDK